MTDSTLELVRIRRIFFFSEDMLRRCTPSSSCGASGDCGTGAEGVGSRGTSCTGFFPSPAASRMFVSASSTVISFESPSPPSVGEFLWVGLVLTISGAELLTQDIQVVVMSAGAQSYTGRQEQCLRSECLVFRLSLCGGVDQHCHCGALGSDSKVGMAGW